MTSSNAEGLRELADPAFFCDPIQLELQHISFYKSALRAMLRIRKVEEKLGDEVTSGKIKCPCHLAIGQEAIAVGLSAELRPADHIFSTHRAHGHFLAVAGSMEQLFAETLGKVTGASKGMGGSMHLFDRTKGFTGSVPIVAGTIPIAVGAALAQKFQKKSDLNIAVCYFGDGAVEEGVFHEALNLASVMQLPVLFVCENNLFSSHLHIGLRQPSDRIARFGEAHRIPSLSIDGNDVALVKRTAEEVVKQIRAGGGPAFLEAVTYRWRGHVGPREDTDVGVRRNQDLPLWKKRDPIQRLKASLIQNREMSETEWQKLNQDIDEEIKCAWAKAEAASFPPHSALLDLVFSQVTKGVSR